MQMTLGLNLWRFILPEVRSEKHLWTAARLVRRKNPKYVVDAINAYIAIRDSLLSEAEEVPTSATLHRICFINEVVEIFLKPARSLRHAQQRSEADTVRERKRCEAVKVRLAELRALIAERRYDHECAGVS